LKHLHQLHAAKFANQKVIICTPIATVFSMVQKCPETLFHMFMLLVPNHKRIRNISDSCGFHFSLIHSAKEPPPASVQIGLIWCTARRRIVSRGGVSARRRFSLAR
jgi:hypothetical protein